MRHGCWLLLSMSVLALAADFGRAQDRVETGVPTIASFEDRNGPLLVGNPYLDGPRNHLGWFATIDIDATGAHVHNQLIGVVPFGGRIDVIALPAADLRWAAAPRFEVGYRFGQGTGELLASYRFLATSGSTTAAAFDAVGNPGALRSRLALNVIDLDYASQEPGLRPWFEMKWRFGVRIAGLLFDSEEASPLLEQRASNYFFGAGPHFSLELWRPIAETRIGLFGKADVAGVFGQVQQSFEETISIASVTTRQTQNMPTTMLNLQLGVAWTPSDTLRLSVGYTYEHWWDAALVNGSHGDVWSQGVFFRGEWRY